MDAAAVAAREISVEVGERLAAREQEGTLRRRQIPLTIADCFHPTSPAENGRLRREFHSGSARVVVTGLLAWREGVMGCAVAEAASHTRDAALAAQVITIAAEEQRQLARGVTPAAAAEGAEAELSRYRRDVARRSMQAATHLIWSARERRRRLEEGGGSGGVTTPALPSAVGASAAVLRAALAAEAGGEVVVQAAPPAVLALPAHLQAAVEQNAEVARYIVEGLYPTLVRYGIWGVRSSRAGVPIMAGPPDSRVVLRWRRRILEDKEDPRLVLANRKQDLNRNHTPAELAAAAAALLAELEVLRAGPLYTASVRAWDDVIASQRRRRGGTT
jgi:hypothetical protein